MQRLAVGAGTTALVQLPFAEKLLASPEPQRSPIVEGAILLNSNENAYGPLPSAMQSMQRGLRQGNRYPFVCYQPLQETVARHHRLQPDQIVMGAGSTELLKMAAQAYCGQGNNAVLADPTFEEMSKFTAALGGEIRKVPLTSNYAHDLDGMLQRVDANTGVVYICNPNNPTASITPANDIETFISKLPAGTVVVIDEAYFHFADGMPEYKTFVERADDRLIVLRTFSKIYGMAGIRLGYSVSSAATAKKLSQYKLPISVSMVAAEGGIASMEDDAAMRMAAKRNAADREEFAKQAAARKLTVIPSYANFHMLKTGRPAKDVIAGFRQHGIVIGRPFSPMLDHVRVSLGLPEENRAFWQAWDQVFA